MKKVSQFIGNIQQQGTATWLAQQAAYMLGSLLEYYCPSDNTIQAVQPIDELGQNRGSRYKS